MEKKKNVSPSVDEAKLCIGLYNELSAKLSDLSLEETRIVLEEMEKYVKLPGYCRCRRLYGYVSEVMLPIYCMKNGLRVRYDDCVPMLGDVIESNRFSRWIHDLAMKVAYRVWKDDGLPEFDALLTGLKLDKIDL